MTLKPPYPWFGGKAFVARTVWEGLGDVDCYVEPFLGGASLLLARPLEHLKRPRHEVVNDIDAFVANFWRAVTHDPDAVARYADYPANQSELTARHLWLVNHKDNLRLRIEGDADYYDAKIAGWWVWGISLWIGSSWCSGDGPWQTENGLLVRKNQGAGVQRKRLHLSDGGNGVHRTSLHDAPASDDPLCSPKLLDYIRKLAQRLRYVKVACTDWKNLLTPPVVWALNSNAHHALTGVVLDPPYAHAVRNKVIYNHDADISREVREWAIANGDNPRLRIVLFGYEEEHAMPSGWRVHRWKAKGGYGNHNRKGNSNRVKETIWFSPHCLKPEVQMPLF